MIRVTIGLKLEIKGKVINKKNQQELNGSGIKVPGKFICFLLTSIHDLISLPNNIL